MKLCTTIAALSLALASACELQTPPFGRPCDAENPCPNAYLCEDGQCVPEALAADAGPADAGS
ncbi:MAG: hypothetical protein IT383_16980 [Deltaproteobacteria bacterium]|nr:hypothetical protein [Deltaproteobacteria bacterium]